MAHLEIGAQETDLQLAYLGTVDVAGLAPRPAPKKSRKITISVEANPWYCMASLAVSQLIVVM